MFLPSPYSCTSTFGVARVCWLRGRRESFRRDIVSSNAGAGGSGAPRPCASPDAVPTDTSATHATMMALLIERSSPRALEQHSAARAAGVDALRPRGDYHYGDFERRTPCRAFSCSCSQL